MEKTTNIFIGCSSRAIPLAKALASYLRKELKESDIKPNVREWYDRDVFTPGRNTLITLSDQMNQCDFAVLLLTGDDFADKKGEKLDLPRDNTIFELGLFTGELGIERCFMVCGAAENALPSDLKGYTRIEISPGLDFANDAECKECVLDVGPTIVAGIKRTRCYEHPKLPLITREELASLERAKADGGQLLLVRSAPAVVVNSVEPVEQDSPEFCVTVLNNLKAGAQYEYYYGDFGKNIAPTATLVLNIATAELGTSRAAIKENLDTVRQNLEMMQTNLSIHFRKRPPLQFCVHNALSEENAVCYLRCHLDDHRDKFVKWARRWDAMQIADELSGSCTTTERDSAIFHSTSDFALAEDPRSEPGVNQAVAVRKTKIRNAVKNAFPRDLPEDFYQELVQRCVGS